MYRKRDDFTFPASAQHPIAHVSATRGRAGVVVTVTGEIDAANAPDLADYVHAHTLSDEWLVLDLSDLRFMGTAGFSALHRIDAQCATADVHWTLVPGDAVARLLRVCARTTRLPTAESLAIALLAVQRDRRRSA